MQECVHVRTRTMPKLVAMLSNDINGKEPSPDSCDINGKKPFDRNNTKLGRLILEDMLGYTKEISDSSSKTVGSSSKERPTAVSSRSNKGTPKAETRFTKRLGAATHRCSWLTLGTMSDFRQRHLLH